MVFLEEQAVKFSAHEFVKGDRLIKADAHAVSTINGVGIDTKDFQEFLATLIIDDVGGGPGTVTYLWGYAEGTGDPIEMTPAAYGERYVLDRDYSNQSSVKVNDDQTVGTTTGNNATVVYPTATRVEYYFDPGSGTSKEGEDWTALRLVFENAQGSWLLIAVIHDARSF